MTDHAPYTPPESEFIRAYALGMRQAFIGSTGEHEEEARRFLTRVRRDAKAEAWDEGFGAGEFHEHNYAPEAGEDYPDNPYHPAARKTGEAMSTDEYVPSEKEVREEYVYGAQEVDMDGRVVVSFDEACSRWDRFLARVRRDAKAEAWDEAYRRGVDAARTAVPQLLDQLDAAEQRIRDLTQEVKDERGAARDQMEQVRIRDARIKAVRELHSESRIIPDTPVFGCAECGEPNETEPCATIRALEG